jgi:hypothetical protein
VGTEPSGVVAGQPSQNRQDPSKSIQLG